MAPLLLRYQRMPLWWKQPEGRRPELDGVVDGEEELRGVLSQTTGGLRATRRPWVYASWNCATSSGVSCGSRRENDRDRGSRKTRYSGGRAGCWRREESAEEETFSGSGGRAGGGGGVWREKLAKRASRDSTF